MLTSSFYNLDITNEGTRKNPLFIHDQYYAVGETVSGDKFTTRWMYCLDNSAQPTFGRTISAPSGHIIDLPVPPTNLSGFIKLAPFTNITVSQLFPSPATGQRVLIEGGAGYIIATKTGTPHEMGVEVDSGKRFDPLTPGMKNIIITGKTKDGDLFSQTGYTIVSGGEPAIFLRLFF